MEAKTNSEMLKSIKSYNKVARESKAVKLGFKNAQELINHLEIEISKGNDHEKFYPRAIEKSAQAKSIGRVTIHVVDVLDASGSMAGAKFNAALKGIGMGVKTLKEDTAEVDYTYTLCDFSNDIIFTHSKALLKNVPGNFQGVTRGATALYDAIGQSVALIKEGLGFNDKVLVNIYTDGQENASRKFNAKQIASMIEDLSTIGWTFTFIGTKEDVAYAQKNLKFHDSNTLVHDNTGAGMEKSFMKTNSARSAYSAKVSLGEDVSKGFYKDIN